MPAQQLIEQVGQGVDVAGVGLIVIGLLITTARFFQQLVLRVPEAYQHYRQGLGYTLLLGLEFLVAADIIRTVAIDPTLESVTVLIGIVLIRTFLGWSLEMELHGRWPWQQGRNTESGVDKGH
ncbi:MAG: DUF1622 domain-containing protein [Ardenticatenales bacterium]|nr:DUF1622 domain-containing protein [Ardenticatenales bacterium]